MLTNGKKDDNNNDRNDDGLVSSTSRTDWLLHSLKNK